MNAKIYGIGVDLVEIARIARGLEKHGERFQKRLFTPAEIAYCESLAKHARVQSYAARFAAKEAISKALRVGVGPAFDWIDLEILRDANGAPACRLQGRAEVFREKSGIGEVHVSLSHTGTLAIAYAMAEIADPPE